MVIHDPKSCIKIHLNDFLPDESKELNARMHELGMSCQAQNCPLMLLQPSGNL